MSPSLAGFAPLLLEHIELRTHRRKRLANTCRRRRQRRQDQGCNSIKSSPCGTKFLKSPSSSAAGTTNILVRLRSLFQRQQALWLHLRCGRIGTATNDWQATAIERHHATGRLDRPWHRCRQTKPLPEKFSHQVSQCAALDDSTKLHLAHQFVGQIKCGFHETSLQVC